MVVRLAGRARRRRRRRTIDLGAAARAAPEIQHGVEQRRRSPQVPIVACPDDRRRPLEDALARLVGDAARCPPGCSSPRWCRSKVPPSAGTSVGVAAGIGWRASRWRSGVGVRVGRVALGSGVDGRGYGRRGARGRRHDVAVVAAVVVAVGVRWSSPWRSRSRWSSPCACRGVDVTVAVGVAVRVVVGPPGGGDRERVVAARAVVAVDDEEVGLARRLPRGVRARRVMVVRLGGRRSPPCRRCTRSGCRGSCRSARRARCRTTSRHRR